MIRVVLVDDQQLVRAGLRRILAPREGFEVVATAMRSMPPSPPTGPTW
jgi:YesN/AraC family two-component response regulator